MAVDISVSTSTTFIVILTLIYALIITPLSLFHTRRLWILNNKNIPFFTKRHPRVVIAIVLIFNIYIIIIRPTADLSALNGVHLGLENVANIGLVIITLRVWLLFYDYNHALHTLALKWQTQITQEIPSKIPWTAKYKWMGDVRTLFIITAIVCVVVLATTIVFHVIFGTVALFYTRACVAILFIIFMLILIFNVRSCSDGFYILKEFKLLMLCIMISMIVFIVCGVLFAPDSNIQLLLRNIWISTTSYILIFVQTYWVIKQYFASKGPEHGEVPAMRLGDHSVGSVSPVASGNVLYKLPLEDILKTKYGFDVFANHLIREFSIENLFFIYEVIQAKNEMLQKKLVNREDVGYMISFDLQHLNQIRRANASVDDMNDLRSTVRYIIGQYIRHDATYSVNVSGETRMAMLNAYHQLEGGGKLVVEAPIDIVYDEDEAHEEDEESQSNGRPTIDFGKINERELNKQYIVLFDNVMKEIIFLLKNDSLKRFYKTDEYRTMIQQI